MDVKEERTYLPSYVSTPAKMDPEEFVKRYTALFDITPEILRKRYRNGSIVKKRNGVRLCDLRKVICIYLREYSSLTLRQVAELVGYGEDHASVIIAIRIARNRFDCDDPVFIPYWNKIYEI